MQVMGVAIADLHFGLLFAAKRYRDYAKADDDWADNAHLYRILARERGQDAKQMRIAATSAGLAGEIPTLNADNTGFLLGLGNAIPKSAMSAAGRVQRAENALGRMAAQLESLIDHRALREALGKVRIHIDERRETVREAKRRARPRKAMSAIPDRDASQSTKGRCVTVWFATNRRRNEQGRFVAERSDSVFHGCCEVFVPKDRKIGSLGRGIFNHLVWGDNRVALRDVQLMSSPTFWSAISNEVLQLQEDKRAGLIFLHGYRTKFEDAARRTAQLKVDLSHEGPAAFFSWPSLGSLIGYPGDEAAMEGSETAIKDFLINFAEQSGVNAVHIIAHSMGNRGLLRAMDAIAKSATKSSSVRFGQIFLAAPDVDEQLFRNLAAAYGQLSVRATLYVTHNDKAIGVSQQFHGYKRVGLAPPPVVIAGIDTIDASDVNLGLIGHSFAAEVRPVLADMHRLIQNDTPPDERFGLRRVVGEIAAYWEFVP